MQKPFWQNPRFSLIAVTGGPCAGKSTIMSKMKQYLEDHGFRVCVLQEAATEFILSGLAPWSEWKDPLLFQECLLEYILMREYLFFKGLLGLKTEKPLVLVSDRGALDARAYIGRENFQHVANMINEPLVELIMERYKLVIHMVTAADGAEAFYTLDNNPARTEGKLEEARALDKRTQNAWLGHPHFAIIDNSTDFDGKINRALRALTRTLGMPDPLEKEHKYVVHNFTPSMIPKDAVLRSIVQDYLISKDDVSRRVRAATVDGTTTYYETEKRKTAEPGTRKEKEKIINKDTYLWFLLERDPLRQTIFKDRYCFTFENSHLELDVFHGHLEGKVYLEIEVGDMSEPVHIPEGWDVTEVTDDESHSNASLAKR